MDLGEISQGKIYGALRSVYRYREMTEGNAPDILVETESELLEKRLALLSAREIFAFVELWPKYLAQQSAVEVIDEKEFAQYLISLN